MHILKLFVRTMKMELIVKRNEILQKVIKFLRISRYGDLCWEAIHTMMGFEEYCRINSCHLC
jgi:hypothetical protein